MFSLPIANTSLTIAPVQYRHQHSLTGVRHSTPYSVRSLETVNVVGTECSATHEMVLGVKLRFGAFEGMDWCMKGALL
jgi:hypothetical protein